MKADLEKMKSGLKVMEQQVIGLSDKNVGQKMDAILSFVVVEKTKSFIVLKVNNIFIKPITRKI